MLTKRGQAFVKTEIFGSMRPMALTKEPLDTVAAVPATPMRRFFVARTAEIEAGSTTPHKGNGQLAADVGRHRAYRSAGGDDKPDAFERRKSASSPRIAANDIPPAVAVGEHGRCRRNI